ncbi:hypothetical protein EVAR_19716_1 [Eumeta japonica]|uniref:Uncharacterized protein n=1 Tax=Eumeta variegata TaxID=151549 RepID=A0A4C1UQG1_EUMVA|nr:hypothetical protein EVAR_19716_1 [Eumeta japonica]
MVKNEMLDIVNTTIFLGFTLDANCVAILILLVGLLSKCMEHATSAVLSFESDLPLRILIRWTEYWFEKINRACPLMSLPPCRPPPPPAGLGGRYWILSGEKCEENFAASRRANEIRDAKVGNARQYAPAVGSCIISSVCPD